MTPETATLRTDRCLATLPGLMSLVQAESRRQVAKWGVQTRTPEEWMLYLTEEVGELAEAVAEAKYRGGPKTEIIKEGVQVATLALKIIEMELSEITVGVAE